MKKIYYLIAMAMMAFTFTSCEDVPEPFGQPINPNKGDVTVDPAGSGTATDPYNVAAALDYVKGLGSDAESPIDVYISGIVTEVTEAFGTQYGNATFKIADVENGKSAFTFYRGLYLGNVKYSDASAVGVNVGDKVVICGRVIYYKGTTPETSQGKAYVVSINGTGGGESGGGSTGGDATHGTAEAPLTVAQAIAAIDAESTISEAYVKGKISKIDSYNATYKSITYWISDDGGTTTQLQVYSGKGLNGADFSAKEDLTVGQTVVIKGALKKYNETYEFDKSSQIISIDGQGGGGSTGGDANHGTAEAPLTVAQAIAAIDAESTISEAYVKGKISKIDSYNATYKSITYWISDDGGTTTQLQVYSGKGLNGADFSAKEDLTVGQTVVIKGALKKYNETYEFDKSSQIISIDGQGGGGSTGGETANHGTAEAPITVAQAIAAIDAESTIDEAYVKGKISKIDSYNATYKSITYWISDDGTTTTQLQVYSGKGLNGADFSSKEDLTVGKTVVIKGKLKKYNTTYEFDKTSSIISIE